MGQKSKIEHNNTKPGLCRRGGSYTHDEKTGKLIEGSTDKTAKKTTKKLTDKDEDGGK